MNERWNMTAANRLALLQEEAKRQSQIESTDVDSILDAVAKAVTGVDWQGRAGTVSTFPSGIEVHATDEDDNEYSIMAKLKANSDGSVEVAVSWDLKNDRGSKSGSVAFKKVPMNAKKIAEKIMKVLDGAGQ